MKSTVIKRHIVEKLSNNRQLTTDPDVLSTTSPWQRIEMAVSPWQRRLLTRALGHKQQTRGRSTTSGMNMTATGESVRPTI